MTSSHLEGHIKRVEERLGRIAEAVLERGCDDVKEEFDDYYAMLAQLEFRQLIILQLYEVYFPPKRHEFELQLITDIVEAIAQSRPAVFLGAAALSGVVGSSVYEISRRLVAYLARKFQGDRRRSAAFREIETNLQCIRDYFKTRKQAPLEDMAEAMKVERDKLEPLLKLLGFKCRKKKKRVWIRPRGW